MATDSKTCKQQTETAQKGMPEVYYPLHSLLHTLRELEAQQDHICTLLTDIQRSGKVSASLRREVAALLHEIPTASLQQEVHAISTALDSAA